MNTSFNDDEHVEQNEEIQFTYHKESGYVGFVWAMLSVCVVETVGVSFLLLKWSPILHWIHLSVSIFVIFFLLADLRAVAKHPISIKKNILSLKIGIRRTVKIHIKQIKEIRKGNLHYENDRKNKEVLDLSLLGLADPTFELVLENPVENKDIFGNLSYKNRIFFSIDNQQAFYNAVKNRKQGDGSPAS